jgi:toxin ParE1/3/4
MDVLITEAAEADLEQIGDFIAQHSRARALTFITELRQKCANLADAPQRCPVLAHYERTGVRRRPHRNYLIFYRISRDVVEILHVLHGARDYEPILFPEEPY